MVEQAIEHHKPEPQHILPERLIIEGSVPFPEGFDPAQHYANASCEIKEYTAIFIVEGQQIGSGVLVRTCGFDGILTAHHVAALLLNCPQFALCITDHPVSLWPRPDQFEHVMIGSAPEDAATDEHKSGPDLSFLIIRDTRLLRIIRSFKSFCFLESQNVSYFKKPLHGMIGAVSGSPSEKCEPIKYDFEPDGPLTKVQNLVAFGYFQSYTKRDGFDYITVKMPCDAKPYPCNYDGVSGAGLWAIPLEIGASGDLNTVSHAPPLLGGVEFYQSAPADGYRIVTCHGFDSLYCGLMQTLSKRRSM